MRAVRYGATGFSWQYANNVGQAGSDRADISLLKEIIALSDTKGKFKDRDGLDGEKL